MKTPPIHLLPALLVFVAPVSSRGQFGVEAELPPIVMPEAELPPGGPKPPRPNVAAIEVPPAEPLQEIEVATAAITKIECDASSGTLVLTIGGVRHEYEPGRHVGPRQARRRVIVSPAGDGQTGTPDRRSGRVLECLALMQAIPAADRVVLRFEEAGNGEEPVRRVASIGLVKGGG